SFLLVFAILINVVVTWLLTGTQGAAGAAWGLMAGFAFLSGGYLHYIRRVTPLAVNWRVLGKLGLILLLGSLAYAACAHWQVHWLVAGSLCSLGIMGLGWQLRLFDTKAAI